MKLLLDTQILLWTAARSELLSERGRSLITDEGNDLYFSPASLWETAIKNGLGRPDFQVDVKTLRDQLLERNYRELAITGFHAAAIGDLPIIHKDPFDRLLLAQARVEGMSLVTSDAVLSRYPAPVILIRKAM